MCTQGPKGGGGYSLLLSILCLSVYDHKSWDNQKILLTTVSLVGITSTLVGVLKQLRGNVAIVSLYVTHGCRSRGMDIFPQILEMGGWPVLSPPPNISRLNVIYRQLSEVHVLTKIMKEIAGLECRSAKFFFARIHTLSRCRCFADSLRA